VDEDEAAAGDQLDLAEDVLLVEALMGWDGDPCRCACGCTRFRDEASELECRPCREGRHASASGDVP
jgi:hypothetical protein